MEIISSIRTSNSIRMNGGYLQNPMNGRREDSLARQSDVTVSNQNSLLAEYTGFFINIISSVVLVSFILWGLVPTFIFEDYLKFDYFPDKYWFVAVPAYSLMVMLYIYILLAAYNTEIKSLALHDIRNFVDEFTVTPGHQDMAKYVHESPSGVCDLPITLVNEVLYNDEPEPYQGDYQDHSGSDNDCYDID